MSFEDVSKDSCMHCSQESSLSIPIENLNLQNHLSLDSADRGVDLDRANILGDFLRPKDIEKKNTPLFLTFPNYFLLLEVKNNPEIVFKHDAVLEVL